MPDTPSDNAGALRRNVEEKIDDLEKRLEDVERTLAERSRRVRDRESPDPISPSDVKPPASDSDT